MSHLVLAGAGHAHLPTLVMLPEFVRRGHRVTVIGADDFHYYSGMGPGLLGGDYAPAQTRFHVAELVRRGGGAFIRDRVTAIDPDHRMVLTAGSGSVEYDVLSCNLGSDVPPPPGDHDPDRVFTVKPIENLLRFMNRISPDIGQIMVVGGGPAGIEVTSNLATLLAERNLSASIDLVPGGHLLGSFPPAVRRRAERHLATLPVRLHPGDRLVKLDRESALLSSGRILPYDLALFATGVKAPRLFAESGLAHSADEGLPVNRFLQSDRHPEIFGGGDCIRFAEQPLAKVGVYAVRQGPVLAANLLAALDRRALIPFRPQRSYLLIFNLGGGRGLLHWHGLTLSGHLVYLLKDLIDRRFMHRYQLCQETTGRQSGPPP